MKKDEFIFTSEQVSDGHPDKVADKISDAILDECLALDRNAHVACETAVGQNFVCNLGELTYSHALGEIDPRAIAKATMEKIGYTDGRVLNFDSENFCYLNNMHTQSPDICGGVGQHTEKQGAGDQGMMFGFATNETPEMMPMPITFANRLMMEIDYLKKDCLTGHYGILPDGKCQVSVLYTDGKPRAIKTVVASNQFCENKYKQIEKFYSDVVVDTVRRLGEKLQIETKGVKILINPSGRFVVGGPFGDSGLTGRKIICDTYGGMGRHGGGAFSGKDPSKVDRSAAYYARYVAKNIVAAGICDKCEIQVAYAIGKANPVSICVNTFGSAKDGLTDAEIARRVKTNYKFDFTPYGICEQLELRDPIEWSYKDTAALGHFGREIFPWEKIDPKISLFI